MGNHAFDVQDVDGRKVVDVRQRWVVLLPNVSLEVMPGDLGGCTK